LFCAIRDHANGFAVENDKNFFFWVRVRGVRAATGIEYRGVNSQVLQIARATVKDEVRLPSRNRVTLQWVLRRMQDVCSSARLAQGRRLFHVIEAGQCRARDNYGWWSL
jgi:hypothetical protein